MTTQSINAAPSTNTVPTWRDAGLPYYAYNFYLRQQFGERVQRVSLDAGFTCPNVDGTVAIGGCTFCDNRSFSPSRRLPKDGVLGQIERGIAQLKLRYKKCRKYLAYFQPASNTYAPVERLRPLYESALAHPQIVGLAIGTRSDCVPDEVLDLLEELAQETYVAVEYGMQTMHDRSLEWMNRGHHHDSFLDAVERSRGRGFSISAHVILGLPGESHQDMLATARELSRVGVDAVKIHNLYVVKNTRLADQYANGEVTLLSRDEYIRSVVEFLELTPGSCVIERVSGEAPPDFFIAPDWSQSKAQLKQAIEQEFAKRGTWQGRLVDS